MQRGSEIGGASVGQWRVALLERNVLEMASTLGKDSRVWGQLTRPFVDQHEAFFDGILRPARGSVSSRA